MNNFEFTHDTVDVCTSFAQSSHSIVISGFRGQRYVTISADGIANPCKISFTPFMVNTRNVAPNHIAKFMDSISAITGMPITECMRYFGVSTQIDVGSMLSFELTGVELSYNDAFDFVSKVTVYDALLGGLKIYIEELEKNL